MCVYSRKWNGKESDREGSDKTFRERLVELEQEDAGMFILQDMRELGKAKAEERRGLGGFHFELASFFFFFSK